LSAETEMGVKPEKKQTFKFRSNKVTSNRLRMGQPLQIEMIRHDKKYPRSEAVPIKPGIYAWFVDFASLEDYIEQPEDFVNYLQTLIYGLGYPPMDAILTGEWHVEFKGLVEQVQNPEALSKLFCKKEARRRFVSIAKAFSPLASPLYIGITEKRTLQERYQEHIDAYDQARAQGQYDEATLGARLAKRNIPPRFLLFGCVPLEPDVARDVKTTETVLNNLFKPVLGRK